jgi:hypothetical protein
MTTDKLTNALIGIIDAIKPDADITVADGRGLADIDLPCIAISIEEPERHSLAIPGVMKCPLTITLRAHYGDGETRETLTDWADAIEQAINLPSQIRDAITESGEGLQCDFFQTNGGSTQWEESTFEAAFTAEAWVVRTA